MSNYLIAFPDEDRAMMELEPFGYAINVVDPEAEPGAELVYAWNQGTAMNGGTGVILSYKAQEQPGPDGNPITVNVPTLAPGFWVSLLSDGPDEELWAQMSANYETIEFGPPTTLSDPPVPSDYVTRSANLTFDINTIKGISPIWGGFPAEIFPYEGSA